MIKVINMQDLKYFGLQIVIIFLSISLVSAEGIPVQSKRLCHFRFRPLLNGRRFLTESKANINKYKNVFFHEKQVKMA